MKSRSFSGSSSIRTYKEYTPQLKDSVYVDPSAVVIGNVTLAEDVSVWPMCVIRGDVNKVTIGQRSNIQDGTVIHESRPKPENFAGYPTVLGDDVTVGHKAMLHGCVIGNRVLIGIGAIVLDGAVIEDEVIVAAGALVTPGKRLESGYLYTGCPAKPARPLTPGERQHFQKQAQDYVELKDDYRAELNF